MKTEPNEFYIGWQGEAPDAISHRVKQFILAVCLVVPLVGALLVLNQRGFATSKFEYGQATEVEGVLVKNLGPFLAVHRGNDMEGNPVFQNILLVARGKHGFGEMLANYEKQQGRSLEGKMVRLKGFLIYHDGKTLMEIEDIMDVKELGATNLLPPLPARMGGGAFMGEIADPKCLFGVMKPGYGKPHRSCAARCIAGGIPPVLKTVSTTGHVQYYLLANENGGTLNQEVLPFVGDQIMVCGELKKMGDWWVIYKNKQNGIALLPEGFEVEIPSCGD